jgi:hypothetical protein
LRTTHDLGPGYYILNPRTKSYHAVEFINNYWYKVRVYTRQAYTSQEDQIKPYQLGTGYWALTDWQHPASTIQRQLLSPVLSHAADTAFEKNPVQLEAADKEAEERIPRVRFAVLEAEELKELRRLATLPLILKEPL